MTQPRRILIVVGSLAPGGTERVAALLAGHWAARGLAVSLLTYSGEKPDHYSLPASVNRLRINLLWESAGLASRAVSEFRRRRLLRESITRSGPDVILSFGEATNVRVLSAAFGLGTPVVVSERVDPRQYAVPRSWHVLRRLLYPLARFVVVQTESVAQWARAFLAASKVRVIPNPVRPISPRSERPATMGHRRSVVAVGRLAEQKGFDVLLDAYARSKLTAAGWQLVILGDGPERDALQRRIDELGLQGAVLMPGVVKNTEQWLQHAQLFVLSSRFEGFPNALLEAMQCGLPVAAFDCPSGPGEIVRHEQTGLLVPAGDVEALAAAIARLAGDADLRQRLGSAAAADVSSRFSLQHIGSMWEELLVGIAGQTR
jgi:GalNAc-alpha-(1->4)-GalNAc-alpha-(1->3)-diNAcBac-PP-undecaprenol alpha-1,4-N-acetyl-D-galactosaminyltransferase